MQMITRKAARTVGLKHYFTGRPCKRGHIDKRFVDSCGCVTCARDRTREKYRALDPTNRQAVYERRKDYVRQWAKANRDRKATVDARRRNKNKEINPNYFRDHYAKNKEVKKQKSRDWYKANTERALKAQREWCAKHRELVREIGRRSASTRRARKKAVFVELVDPRVVFERAKGVCGICRKRVDMNSRWEVDHVIPVSKGGTHSYDNVQLAHRKCNREKSAKLPKGQPTLFQVATQCD